jgi:SH3-like domain-containing protein
MMRKALAALSILIAGGLALTQASAQEERKTPYWASISAGEALMRTGPGRNYPATWLYRRADLPIKVIEVYPSWRKVQDPDGTTGWMLVNLLSDTRTAIVRGSDPAPMHEAPDANSRIRFRAEPGVVGRLSNCTNGWCRLDVKGRAGFIRIERIWGVDSGEKLS